MTPFCIAFKVIYLEKQRDETGQVVWYHGDEATNASQSKLLVSPLIIPRMVPYILSYITPFEEFRIIVPYILSYINHSPL